MRTPAIAAPLLLLLRLEAAAAGSVTVGDTRVTALSETLVRIEQKGPRGFFDEASFNVVGRDGFGDGLAISTLNTSAAGTWLGTSAYDVFVPSGAAPGTGCAGPTCTSTLSAATVAAPDGKLLYKGANTFTNASQVAANHLHWPSPLDAPSYAFNDFPRFTAPAWGPTPIPRDAKVPAELVATNGYDFTNNVDGDTYVFLLGDSLEGWWKGRADFMTLTGPTPLLPDFAYGIWYTWYVVYTEQRAKDEVGNWTDAKFPLDVWGLDMNWRNVGANEGSKPGTAASVALCRQQTKAGAQDFCRSHFYNHPDTDLLPGLTMTKVQKGSVNTNEWFEFLKSKKLRTYFNDHPFPVGNQTTPPEVAFRYNGLSEWIGRGLSYWWFDHNWAFTVPGPLMPYDTTAAYQGMSGQVWGSQIYYESTRVAYKEHGVTDRPIALSRDNGPNWNTRESIQSQTFTGSGSPAHHRFPVWWTGDGVPLMADVGAMTNEAVHDFRSYVHSDCGGHGSCNSIDPPHVPGQPPPPPPENKPCETPTDQALLRWTSHCVFGTMVRFHQGDHRFWLRDETTQSSARDYLNMRYKLAPSLIAAGRTVQEAGFPLTARCDMVWPEHKEANDVTQYLHLNTTLIAPLEGDPADHENPVLPASRSVWLPPGEWQDGWTGKSITGPQTMQVTPTESEGKFQIPMWHKKGGLVVAVQEGEQRINDQSWDELTIEGFPLSAGSAASSEERNIYEQEGSPHGEGASTTVSLHTDGVGGVRVGVSASVQPRSWVVRLHLKPGERLALSDAELAAAGAVGSVRHLEPRDCEDDTTDGGSFFPFKGPGTAPACEAGPIAEFRLQGSATETRNVEGSIAMGAY